MKRIYVVVLALAVLIVDRLTKMIVVHGWSYHVGFFRLERFDNVGLVFSIPIHQNIAIAIMSIVILGLALWAWRHRSTISTTVAIACGCILLGAISNLTDRIVYGAVIDWISFGRWFPIFNIADLTIAAGVLLWVKALTDRPKIG